MRWGGRRAIPLLLAAATLLPIAALGWLSARILQQDRAIERQRRVEDLKLTAGRLALQVEGRLAGIEDQLAKGRGIRFTAAGLRWCGSAEYCVVRTIVRVRFGFTQSCSSWDRFRWVGSLWG